MPICQPSSILVYVGLDRVGDGLIKLPFVRALRSAFPDARITWLAGKGPTVYGDTLAPLVTGLIDEVLADAGVGSNWPELFGRPLAGRHFDLVIDTQRRVLTTLILKRIPHGCFVSGAADYWLSDLKPTVRAKPAAMIQQLLGLVELARGGPAGAPAPLSLAPEWQAEAARRLPDGRVYVGLAPGAGGKHKCWPLENYIALGLRLMDAGRVPVYFLGPDERAWEGDIRGAVPAAIFPVDGTASPVITIALGKRLAAAVANDSGAGHMLAASEIPLLSLFGPTSPDKFAPTTPRLSVLRAQEFGGERMEAIPLGPVADRLEQMIGAEDDTPGSIT